MAEIGLIHVVYRPFGPSPLQQFVESYRRHPAGIDHELILIFKAFEGKIVPEEFLPVFDGLPHRALFLPDGGFDLGSYFVAASACEHRFLCFLNSRSVILADGWLAKLRAALDQPGVGLVGATGTAESFSTSAWRNARASTSRFAAKRLARRVWNRVLFLRARRTYPPFPNPHLRTNAFMMDRQSFQALRGFPFRTKDDCYRFESGGQSLTRQVQARGLAVRVVGGDGSAYPPERWRESETFRAGEQGNLLVADNQTRDYLASPPDRRRWLANLAWEAQG